MKTNTAFVAMKFDGEHWSDKRYSVISDVLKEAGYDPVRADQIKSSGPVVEEVWDYLENSSLVVIDDTGDSLSVAYEIGYCHGIKRPPEKILLLKQGTEIPFNYRHFRHHCYKDLKNLRRLLRERLDLSTPLSDDQFGYSFTFAVLPGASIYGLKVARCFLQSLQKLKFTGRGEFFAANRQLGKDNLYTISLGLKFAGNKSVPEGKWWMKFKEIVVPLVYSADCNLEYAEECSEFNALSAMRATMLPNGTAQFENGLPSLVVGGDASPEESWFLTAFNELLSGTSVEQTD
jgi:hypothetical protein